jgi:dihydroorotate dehydrogenase
MAADVEGRFLATSPLIRAPSLAGFASMSLYTFLFRPLLFRLDAETAHHFAVETCRWLGAVPGIARISRACLEQDEPCLRSEVAGLSFANPIGLGAGWDKSGRALRMLDSLGFGFAEIGSVSARPSRGNPRPRLFRLPGERAIIVNYGLPNEGAGVVAARLAAARPLRPIGVNIVKTNWCSFTPRWSMRGRALSRASAATWPACSSAMDSRA